MISRLERSKMARPKVRQGVLAKNIEKTHNLLDKGFRIVSNKVFDKGGKTKARNFPMVFHSRKAAFAGLKANKTLQKKKDRISIRKMQSVFTGKPIFVFAERKE